jgi:carbon monoxide dehydrogenase subunit G
MALKIVVVLAIAVSAILIFAATKPDTIRVQRSININASPEIVFSLVDDFHHWNEWAPQDKEDRTMTRTYSGAARGVGAVSNWDSKGNAGRGRMMIVQSANPRQVTIQVDFVKPFAAHNVNEFTLVPGSTTTVTWSMQGSNLYIMKLMGTFVKMDGMMGKHFESGLRNLKKAAEDNAAGNP